jgi:hypothetical protein
MLNKSTPHMQGVLLFLTLYMDQPIFDGKAVDKHTWFSGHLYTGQWG